MTVAPPYDGPRGPAPDVGLGALAQVIRWAYATGQLLPPTTDEAAVAEFAAFLVGQGPPRVPVRLSTHARRRARQMDVPEAEVVAAVEDPELDVPANGDCRRVASRGRLAVVYAPTSAGVRHVVTVLWRGADHR